MIVRRDDMKTFAVLHDENKRSYLSSQTLSVNTWKNLIVVQKPQSKLYHGGGNSSPPPLAIRRLQFTADVDTNVSVVFRNDPLNFAIIS